MITPDEFVQIFLPSKNKKFIRFAKIAPSYVSGRPQLIFDGESTLTVKKYVYLSSYTPVAGDRVVVINDIVFGGLR